MLIKKEELTAIDFNGLEILDYTAGCKEKSSFAVITVKPKAVHPLSWSKRSDKYYYIINGSIEFSIDAKSVTLTAGDFCIIKKGHKFKYTNNTDAVVTLVLVHTPCFNLKKEVYR